MELTEREKEFIKLSTAELRKSAGVQTYQVTELEQFTHLDLNFYKKITGQAAQHGFQWLADFESPSINERDGIKAAIRILLDENREHCCAIWHLKPKWFLRLVSLLFRMGPMKVVEFETRFNDQTFVVTTTAKEQSDIYHPPEIVHHAVGQQAFDHLYDLHRMHVHEHLSQVSGRAVEGVRELNDVFSMQQLMDQHTLRHMEANHYLALEQLPKSLRENPDKRAAAIAYAEQLQDHKAAPADAAMVQQPPASSDFSRILQSAGLQHNPHVAVNMDGCDRQAWVVGTDHANALKHWQQLQQAGKNQYLPVITQLFIEGEDLGEQVENLGLLDRDAFESEMEFNDQCGFSSAAPEAVLAATDSVNHQKAVKRLLSEQLITDRQELEAELEYDLESLQSELGSCPDLAACQAMIRDGRIKHSAAWQGWLLNWVLRHHRDEAMEFTRSDLSKDFRVTHPGKFGAVAAANMAIVMLPVKHAWQVPALIHTEVAETIGSEALCALARHWQEQHQARIIGMDNCTIEWYVGKPPKTLKEALNLAVLHNALAPGMLAQPDIKVWQYALSLLGRKRWCLWESPA
jgi:hypothetical protein